MEAATFTVPGLLAGLLGFGAVVVLAVFTGFWGGRRPPKRRGR